jgi:hypothetical protein
MQFEGAVVTEQGVTFAIVVVKRPVVDSSTEAGKAIRFYQKYFPGLPVVLMAQDPRGTPTYRGGRRDIVKFLASIDFRRIPWKRYTAT